MVCTKSNGVTKSYNIYRKDATETSSINQWTPVTSTVESGYISSATQIHKFVTNGNIIIGVGGSASNRSSVWYTYNKGETWNYLVNPFGDYQGEDVVYANGIFVAVAANEYDTATQGTYPSVIYTSSDGITWTNRYTSTSYQFLNIIYDNYSQLFTVTGKSANGTVKMQSPNGINWMNNTIMSTYNIANGIASSNRGTLLMVGGTYQSTGTVGFVSRGGNLTVSNVNTDLLDGVEYLNNKYVAYGRFGWVIFFTVTDTSISVSSMTQIKPSSESSYNISWEGITYMDGKYILVGQPQAMAISSDGVNWTFTEYKSDLRPNSSTAYQDYRSIDKVSNQLYTSSVTGIKNTKIGKIIHKYKLMQKNNNDTKIYT